MAAAEVDLVIEQGATWTTSFVWESSAGVPVDLSGYTARMQIRKSVKEPSFYVELTTENNRIAITGATGTIALTLSDEETEALAFATGVYDLELESAAGVVTRLTKGKVTLDPNVTR